MNYVLDASALLVFFVGGAGADTVEDILTEPSSACLLHPNARHELYIEFHDRGGDQIASDLIGGLQRLPLSLWPYSELDFVSEIAALRERYPHFTDLDRCNLALAKHLDGKMVTADPNLHQFARELAELGFQIHCIL